MAYNDFTGATQASVALLTNIKGMLSELYTTYVAEIEAGRDGESSLLDKMNALDTAIAALAAGSGVIVSANDTVVGVLNGKLVAGTGISLTEGNDGGDETFTIAATVAGTATEYTKAQNFNATTLSDGANISWDLESNQVCSVTLAGNRTLDNPTNMKDGATYILIVKQDGTGSRTLGYDTAYKWPGGNAPTLSTGASAVDILTFISDGTNMYGVASLDFS